jgi:diketogulonate reductase-like aldo/keto reductase
LSSNSHIQIQTKFTPYKPGRDPAIYPYDISSPLETQIADSIASSLSHFTIPSTFTSSSPTNLPAPYLDTVLLHSPLPTADETLQAWTILERFVPHQIRHLGISNVDLPLLRKLWVHAKVKPAAVQNRFAEDIDPEGKLPVPTPVDPFDEEVRRFCTERGIRYQPWGVVWGNERLKASKVVQEIADEVSVNRDIALYLVVLSLGEVSVFVGSTREDRIKAAVDGFKRWEDWAAREGNQERWAMFMSRLYGESGLR